MSDPLEQLRSGAAAALPPTRGRLIVPGLHRPVEVRRDPWGVPHISAESVEDLLFAQGFVVASERLFQIDLLLRMANGRLAELISVLGVPLDRFARTVGWNRAGRRIAADWDEESRAIVATYRAGACAWLDAMPSAPVEYAVLETEPSLPQDDASWAAAIVWMAWSLSGNWDDELLRAEILERLGPEAVEDLFPERPPVPSELVAGRLPSGLDLLRAAPAPRPGQGSNNWVVAGSRSATGSPLLANDPHLAIMAPSIWIELHLSAPGYEAAGVALPFAPGIVIGHTEHHAWGFTNVGGDTQDLYLERLSEDGRAAEFEGGWEPVAVHREEISVRGTDEPVVVEVRETRHGPLLDSYVVGVAQPEVVEGGVRASYALRWTGHEAAIQPSSVLRIAQAPSFEGFRESVRGWEAPGQNAIYADVEGTIGYQCTGRYPIRRAGDGTMPVPGWTSEHEWDDVIPFEELPWAKDPEEGFLATANNRICDDDYPYLIGHDWSPPSRIARIGELLTSEPLHSVDSFAEIQRDTVSLPARALVPLLSAAEPEDERRRAAVELLRAWDGDTAVDSAAACVYETWCHHLAEVLLRPRLGDELFTHLYGRRLSAWRSLVLPGLLERADDRWFGPGGADARRNVLRRALDATLDELEDRLGPDVSAWRWGALHRVRFEHPLAAIPGLGELLAGAEVEVPGDDDTVNVGAYEPERRFRVAVLPSWRMVVDLSDPDGAVGCHTTGQSGHPASPHWVDLVPTWAGGGHHPLPFTGAAVEAVAPNALTLAPR